MKVLVVEDEIIVGMDLVMLLEEWGYSASGPHPSPERALDAITDEAPDIALLDINLGNGKTSLPVAEALQERDTPFVFLTGYSSTRFPHSASLEEAPRLGKPVDEHALRSLLEELAPVAR